jgi:hypothetical protein
VDSADGNTAPRRHSPRTAGCLIPGPDAGSLVYALCGPGPQLRGQVMVFFSRPRILNTALVCSWETRDSVMLSTIPISFMVNSSK